MALKNFLICDDKGYPFYNKSFHKFDMVDPGLFSGLISAIGSIGKKLFRESIAQISFGTDEKGSKIAVIAKELFSLDKKIFFVFMHDGDMGLQNLRELSTNIYIETKNMFRNKMPDVKTFRRKINRIIDSQYHGLSNW